MADPPTPPTPQKDALTTILEQLPEIEQLPEKDRERIVQIVQVAKQSSGPLPAPEDFERYNRELPGAADRILAMAERVLDANIDDAKQARRNERLRVYGSTATSVAVLVIAGLATLLEIPIIAIPLGLGGIVSVIARYLFNWLKSSDDRTP